MQFDSRPVVVYGIKLANKEIASLVRKVLILSFLAAAVVIALTVLNFTILKDRNTIPQSILTCIIGLLIPFMGWIGAKASNQNLIGMFCGFSFTCGIFNLIIYIIVIVSIRTMYVIIQDCSSLGTVVVNGKINNTYCEDYTMDSLRNMYIIASALSVPVIFLQCIGAFYGNKLYSSLTPGVVITYETAPPRVYGGIVPKEAAVIHVQEV